MNIQTTHSIIGFVVLPQKAEQKGRTQFMGIYFQIQGNILPLCIYYYVFMIDIKIMNYLII